MDNFKTIYRILKTLERAMDDDEFAIERISPESLGVSKNRLNMILSMLVNDAYIGGVSIKRYKSESNPIVLLVNPKITIKGLEYLQENSFMRKAANDAKGIAEIIS